MVLMSYDYLVDRHEVTRQAFRRFLCEERVGGMPDEIARCLRSPELANPENPEQIWTFPEGQEDHPISGLSWCDAAQYCAWAHKRLPFEAEWERMARGSQNRSDPYPWHRGSADSFEPTCLHRSFPELCRFGTVSGECCTEVGPVTRAGGFARVGQQDIQHVGGQVAEWVYDYFLGPYPFTKIRYPRNPIHHHDRSAPPNPNPTYVLRGGAYNEHSELMVTSRRELRFLGRRDDSAGVRCVRTFGLAPPELEAQYVPESTMQCANRDGGSVSPVRGEAYLVVHAEYPPTSKIGLILGHANRSLQGCQTRLALVEEAQGKGGSVWSMGLISRHHADYHMEDEYAQGFRAATSGIGSEHQVLEPTDETQSWFYAGVGEPKARIFVDRIEMLGRIERDARPEAPDIRVRLTLRIHPEDFEYFGDSNLADAICRGALCDPGEDPMSCLTCDGDHRGSCWGCRSISLTVDAVFRKAERVFSNGECRL